MVCASSVYFGVNGSMIVDVLSPHVKDSLIYSDDRLIVLTIPLFYSMQNCKYPTCNDANTYPGNNSNTYWSISYPIYTQTI